MTHIERLEGTEVRVLGISEKIVEEFRKGGKAGYFVSYDLPHFETQKANANPKLKKLLGRIRVKLYHRLKKLGCPRMTDSLYRIPNESLIGEVESTFAEIEEELSHWHMDGQSSVLIMPLIATEQKWEEMHATAMDNTLIFLQRKIAKLSELDAQRTFEGGDRQTFTNARREVGETVSMVEATRELRESAQKVEYDSLITLADELINSLTIKFAQYSKKRGTVSK